MGPAATAYMFNVYMDLLSQVCEHIATPTEGDQCAGL